MASQGSESSVQNQTILFCIEKGHICSNQESWNRGVNGAGFDGLGALDVDMSYIEVILYVRIVVAKNTSRAMCGMYN